MRELDPIYTMVVINTCIDSHLIYSHEKDHLEREREKGLEMMLSVTKF